MQQVQQSAGEVSSSTPSTNGMTSRTVAMRDGSITLTKLIDVYMAEYTGRDTTRTQRLRLWVERLGHMTIAELDDDVIHDAMEHFGMRPANTS